MLEYIEDLVESMPPDKSLHEWAQSTKEGEHVISHMTMEGQTILDPLMGSAVIGISALKLGRQQMSCVIRCCTYIHR